ncbi:colicin uptake protein TolR [Thorsellia anophelis]|uniref:Tol-Pal system protein TolR n=1 Tax=Thorsellia anophelis DSM 18579 TaxID=1123402 RepID=A0A1H9ZVJ9_9GAMM|nr:colicin uptake protein TolR [Thorsellia anophelis]SES85406.1 Cell division and transport-associated protein TolR [Thorsellia anophelis DSM 18579]
MSRRRTRSSKRELKSEINIVPFLDVLLVLLLIFMATAPVISQSVEVDLPNASDSSVVDASENPPVIVEVSDVNVYVMIVNQERSSPLTEALLVEEAKQQLLTNPQTTFLIGGAKQVEYNEIIKALDTLRLAGVTKVGLMTQPLN